MNNYTIALITILILTIIFTIGYYLNKKVDDLLKKAEAIFHKR